MSVARVGVVDHDVGALALGDPGTPSHARVRQLAAATTSRGGQPGADQLGGLVGDPAVPDRAAGVGADEHRHPRLVQVADELRSGGSYSARMRAANRG